MKTNNMLLTGLISFGFATSMITAGEERQQATGKDDEIEQLINKYTECKLFGCWSDPLTLPFINRKTARACAFRYEFNKAALKMHTTGSCEAMCTTMTWLPMLIFQALPYSDPDNIDKVSEEHEHFTAAKL